MMTSVFFLILHAALFLAVIVRVLLRRPARGVVLAWLLLTAALPYLGAVGYFLVGERRISRERAARLARSREGFRELAQAETALLAPARADSGIAGEPQTAALPRAAARFFGISPVPGNSFTLHADTLGILSAIAADIDQARSSVLMEFYIWNAGGLTGGVLEALIRAAGRGVTCYVLVDAMGAGRWWKTDEPERLRAAGVELRAALPVGLLRTIAGRTDLRLHRKIVVIDSTIGWTGSMNMVDPRFFKQEAHVGEWVDAMTRFQGPVAGLLAAVMLSDWIAEGGDALPDLLAATKLSVAPRAGSVPVQVLPSGPGPGASGEGLLQVMLSLINAAQRELVLTTPYFVPEDTLVTALRGAGARGVRVVVVLPEKIDSMLVRHASRSFFDEILEFGGEIRAYRGGLLHTKSMTVDGRVALFGTANFDMRSLWLNFEVSLLVDDAGFAGELRALQQGYIDRSVSVVVQPWAKLPLPERLFFSAMRLMSPLL